MGSTEGYCKLKLIDSFRKYCIMYQEGTEGTQALKSRIQIDLHHQFPTCRDFEGQIFTIFAGH